MPFLKVFFGVLHLATYISLFFVFTGIDPGMAFTPFPYSIWKRQDSNPRPFDREPSSLITTPSSHSDLANLAVKSIKKNYLPCF